MPVAWIPIFILVNGCVRQVTSQALIFFPHIQCHTQQPGRTLELEVK